MPQAFMDRRISTGQSEGGRWSTVSHREARGRHVLAFDDATAPRRNDDCNIKYLQTNKWGWRQKAALPARASGASTPPGSS